jgi:hypothetical protein
MGTSFSSPRLSAAAVGAIALAVAACGPHASGIAPTTTTAQVTPSPLPSSTTYPDEIFLATPGSTKSLEGLRLRRPTAAQVAAAAVTKAQAMASASDHLSPSFGQATATEAVLADVEGSTPTAPSPNAGLKWVVVMTGPDLHVPIGYSGGDHVQAIDVFIDPVTGDLVGIQAL